MRYLMSLLLVMATAGCTAKVGAQEKTIPSDAAGTCEAQCQQIGLHMTAVAIMAETLGCVCQATDAGGAPGAAGNAGATSAGMATIMFQEAAARRQQQQQAAARSQAPK